MKNTLYRITYRKNVSRVIFYKILHINKKFIGGIVKLANDTKNTTVDSGGKVY